MKCSFIVSAYDRPRALEVCLLSLRRQTCTDYEVIVTDNAPASSDIERGAIALNHELLVQNAGHQFRYVRTTSIAGADCYQSANYGATVARGDYLCFPSDDGYYAPRFLELMLRRADDADLVYCNCVWDGRGYGRGEELIHLQTEPRAGKIDKGGFLVKRDLFLAAGMFRGPWGVDRAEDGRFIEQLIAARVTHRKVELTGWIHN